MEITNPSNGIDIELMFKQGMGDFGSRNTILIAVKAGTPFQDGGRTEKDVTIRISSDMGEGP